MMRSPFGEHSALGELDDLRRMFIPETSDRRVDVVVNEDPCPILGRRGTGKSALAVHLENLVLEFSQKASE